MRRLGIAFASIGALLMLLSQIITPAVATHVNEPTAPITDFQVSVIHYVTKDPVDCSGQTPFTHDAIRIQAKVKAAAKPSEHFGAQLQVNRLENLDGDPALEKVRGAGTWESSWLHQNIPPHSVAPYWQLDHEGAASYGLLDHPGVWEVKMTVTTLESAQVLVYRCRFRVAA